MDGLILFFNSFGPIAYLLLLSSIIILALSIERLITIYTQPKPPIKQVNNIVKYIKAGDFEQVKSYSASLPKIFQEWVEILLLHPREMAEDELSLSIGQKRIALQRSLEWLNLFAIISPMLGLLGTIWSMSHSFNLLGKTLSSEGMNKMIVYLSEAMYATAFGIVLALISMLSLYFLRQKSEQYLSQCEYAFNKISLALTYYKHMKDKPND